MVPNFAWFSLALLFSFVLCCILPIWVFVRGKRGKPSPGMLPYWVFLGLFLGCLVLAVIGHQVSRLIIITGPSALVLIALGFGFGLWLRSRRKQPTSSFQARWCPDCGNQLPANAPHGICPRCLLRQGLDSPLPVASPKLSPPTSPYGAPFLAPSPAELAPLFPQLEILELLGQGGMGAVYKARQAKLDRLVALKILPSEAGRDPAFAERFNREARALAKLNHPNIVGVHDFGEAGDLFYFIMEYVDGVNLRQVLQADRLGPADALRIVPQLCDALQYAHDEAVVHRDIKPENILIDKRGRAKIADFGLAKLLGPATPSYTLTGSRQIMGTPHYMAPEQMEKPSTVDHRADIYSLGVVFYEMLTGELPLGRFALPSEKAPVDGRLDEIVLRTLEKDPGRRYQRVSEVKTDMEAMTGAMPSPLPVAAPIRSFQDEVELEMRRLQVVGPAIGLMVVAVLGVVFWAVLGTVAIIEEAHHYSSLPRGYWIDMGLCVGILTPIVGISAALILVGGRRMMRCQRYEYVLFASIWAMLPWSGPVWFIGLAMGAWALRILRRPEVKMAFIRNAVHARLSTPPSAPLEKRQRGQVHSLFGAVGSLFFGSRVQSHQPIPTVTLAPAGQEFSAAADELPAQAKHASFHAAKLAAPPPMRVTLHPAVWMALFLLVAILLAGGLLFSRFVIVPDGSEGNGVHGRDVYEIIQPQVP
ncbi:MAG TPA: serine/threonine-protein kinase [Gemmataceae bacterium]|nr:serine/threonine-protein kinase [Gemmataceae bacterium]